MTGSCCRPQLRWVEREVNGKGFTWRAQGFGGGRGCFDVAQAWGGAKLFHEGCCISGLPGDADFKTLNLQAQQGGVIGQCLGDEFECLQWRYWLSREQRQTGQLLPHANQRLALRHGWTGFFTQTGHGLVGLQGAKVKFDAWCNRHRHQERQSQQCEQGTGPTPGRALTVATDFAKTRQHDKTWLTETRHPHLRSLQLELGVSGLEVLVNQFAGSQNDMHAHETAILRTDLPSP